VQFQSGVLLILYLVLKTGTWTGCFCSIPNKLQFILVFSFITNAKMQNGKPAIISGWYGWYGVWYGIRWDGMSVCLLIDDRCGRRWSSFVYRLRRTCVSAFDPRTSPLGSIHLLLEQLHSQIGANAFEFVWPAAKSIDNQSAPVQFGQPSCQFAQSAQVHSKKLFNYLNFNMYWQLAWNDRELTHIILIYNTR